MDTTTFTLFEEFDFENNQHFQAGWSSIEQLISPQTRKSEYLRAQAFYFSRNVRSFDYQQYLQWRDRKQTHADTVESNERKDKEKLDCDDRSDTHDDSKYECQDVNSLSLAEVARLIQNNQPIPGIVSVDVKPSNADPTPSKLIRKSKPWENSETAMSQQTITSGDFSEALS